MDAILEDYSEELFQVQVEEKERQIVLQAYEELPDKATELTFFLMGNLYKHKIPVESQLGCLWDGYDFEEAEIKMNHNLPNINATYMREEIYEQIQKEYERLPAEAMNAVIFLEKYFPGNTAEKRKALERIVETNNLKTHEKKLFDFSGEYNHRKALSYMKKINAQKLKVLTITVLKEEEQEGVMRFHYREEDEMKLLLML